MSDERTIPAIGPDGEDGHFTITHPWHTGESGSTMFVQTQPQTQSLPLEEVLVDIEARIGDCKRILAEMDKALAQLRVYI